MSRLISLYAEGFSKNSCFETINIVHPYFPTDLYRALRGAFAAVGYELNTADLNLGKSVVAEVYIDAQVLSGGQLCPRFLLAYENPIFNPLNKCPDYFGNFQKIITWNCRVKTFGNVEIQMVPNRFIERNWASFADRPLLLALINANKAFRNPIQGDLYKERLALIRYCEKNRPEDFRLYGRGWDKPTPSYRRRDKLKRTWTRFRTKVFGYRPFPSYAGEVADKHDVYGACKFAVCYENFSGWDNYITEKIFDAFFSGCVPVYWGAPNVLDYLPASTFVDRRQFATDADLLSFLSRMDERDYLAHQQAIADFLQSDSAKKFELDSHVQHVVQSVVATLR